MSPLMPLLFTALAAVIVAVQAAAAGDFVMPKFAAPRISHLPQSFEECFAQPAPVSGHEEAIYAKLTIKADGMLKEFSLPDDSPRWMKGLADCALAKLQFSPGTWDGVAAESRASVMLKFRAHFAEDSFGIGIEQVGPLVTYPRLVRLPEGTADCFPASLARRGNVARFVVSLTILPDGRVTNVTLPVGSEAWHGETARCVLERIAFIPGTRDGFPVEAQASLPIVYEAGSGEVSTPELRSSNEELEAAYRACYPLDLASIASAFYRFDIATNGRVSNPKVVKGSGDPRLDAAGACILIMLEFKPLLQSGRGIRSSVTWELPIRPPR